MVRRTWIQASILAAYLPVLGQVFYLDRKSYRLGYLDSPEDWEALETNPDGLCQQDTDHDPHTLLLG